METVEMKPNVKVARYTAYADTGIEWLGVMPSHWKVLKGKRLFKKEERPVRQEDDIVTCFRDGQVTLRSNRRSEGFTNALKEHGYQGIRKGDLVIHNMDAFAGAVGVSDSDGKSTPVYSACTPLKENFVNPYYYAYFLRDLAKSGYIESLAKGIRERSTDFRFNDFGVLLLPVPTYAEQTRIAEFLDKKIAQIDQAITQKERQIELLKERRQILIHNAVTRGLNPDVKMKDSGIEWIGEMPDHWTLLKIKRVTTKITDGEHISPQFTNEGVPFLSAKDIKEDGVTFPNNKFVSSRDSMNFRKRCNPEKGDILMVSRGATIGRVCMVATNEEFCLLGTVILFKPKANINNNYLLNALQNKLLQEHFLFTSHHSAQQAIYLTNVSEVYVAIPSREEQEAIVEYLENASRQTTTIVAIKEQEIEKLKEYKATLINAAVTGKIKV